MILVTGASGFIGGHCVLRLLADGHHVRATLRDQARERSVRTMLKEAGADADERLSFVTADLESDAGWANATTGCEYVLHIASPASASDGALRVLRAARDAGVKRVVVTSSFAAVGYGHPPREKAFDESDWTNVDGADVHPYIKSKTLAERAAWDFMAREGGHLELCAVNPVGVFGPLLGEKLSSSVAIVAQMLEGKIFACPRISFGVVDVRDVADLHVRAMTNPAAKGERFIAVAGDAVSLFDVANMLRRRMGAQARRAPRFELPDWFMRIAALRNPALRSMVPQIGKIRNASNEKAQRVLGWSPRSSEDAIVASAESLVRRKKDEARQVP